MPTKWVRDWICCPKHFQRNVTDPTGPANFQTPLQWIHYILPTLTQLSVSTSPFCPFHRLIFFSFNVSQRGAVRNCRVRSVSLVCRGNIPQIIPPVNVSDSQSQAPSQLTFCVSEKREAESSARGRHSSWELNQYNTWGSQNSEWLPPPIAEVILKPQLALQELTSRALRHLWENYRGDYFRLYFLLYTYLSDFLSKLYSYLCPYLKVFFM